MNRNMAWSHHRKLVGPRQLCLLISQPARVLANDSCFGMTGIWEPVCCLHFLKSDRSIPPGQYRQLTSRFGVLTIRPKFHFRDYQIPNCDFASNVTALGAYGR